MPLLRRVVHIVLLVTMLTVILTVGVLSAPSRAVATDEPLPEVLIAAGDIARCGSSGADATAALLDSLPGTIATLGDNAYEGGTAAEFAACYAPSWGRHKSRTRPAPGNHDYSGTRDLRGYFEYFGAQAPSNYYAYDLGAWHIVALDSNCDRVDCRPGSRQERWLRADLREHDAVCTLAYMHHPRFSSGPHGGTSSERALWEAMYEAGVDVVLAGHDHLYERFAPRIRAVQPTGIVASASSPSAPAVPACTR